MTRWLLVALGVIGLLSLAEVRLYSPQAKADAKAPAAPVLSGKPLFVQAKDNAAYTFETADVRPLGGRMFLVGRPFKTDPYKLTGTQFGGSTVWVPVDSIIQLVELEPHNKPAN